MFLIDVDGFTIWGERQRNAPSPVFLNADGFTGWDDTPDMRRDSIARVNAHGEFDAAGYLSARTASFSGHVVTESAAETAALGRRLRGLLSFGQMGRVTVHRDDVVEWSDGRLASSTKFTQHGADPTTADWQLQLWFPDPHKYGNVNVSETVSGDDLGTIRHYGNTWATSTLTITGQDADGYIIVGPGGRRIDVNVPLTAGVPHTLDTGTGLLRVGGAVTYAALGRAELWRTAPGKTTTFGIGGTGSGTKISAHTLDTYI
jgi:hypothetical protein